MKKKSLSILHRYREHLLEREQINLQEKIAEENNQKARLLQLQERVRATHEAKASAKTVEEVKSLDEAAAYLRHPILGRRLHESLKALEMLDETTADRIFGELDAMKFRSSLTLFAEADPSDPVIEAALDRWFQGQKDEKTLQLLGRN